MNFKYILPLILVMSAWSCESTSVPDEGIPASTGTFSVVRNGDYLISMPETKSMPRRWNSATDDMSAEIIESDWSSDGCPVKSGIYDEIEWRDEALVGLFITDTDGNILKATDSDGSIQNTAANLALNPRTYKILDLFYGSRGEVSNAQSLNRTAFFWNNWSRKDYLSGVDKVNFYGVYPRPYDLYQNPGAGTIYNRNSLITAVGFWTEKKEWNSIHYEIWRQQTDDNLYQMDLMYSVAHDASEDNVGNQSKGSGDNVLMPFAHVFCLLNFEIRRGENFVGDGKITEMSLSGPEISTAGKLDIKNGTLDKDRMTGRISRECTEESEVGTDTPFRTSMIVPPTSKAENGVVLRCTIDGVDYRYVFPDDIAFESGKKYDIRLKVSPTGISTINIWRGAKVSVNDGAEVSGTTSVNKGYFEVSLESGYAGYYVLKNRNERVTSSEGNRFTVDENSVYNVVTVPDSWYVLPESTRVQFDGLWNNSASQGQDASTYTWSDLSGHDNNGNLQRFNASATSGWNDNGLVFDGIDDIVVFPGTINPTEYTMEFYLCFNKQNENSVTPRLNAEGTEYPAYYLRRSNNSWTVGLYGHNCVQWDSDLYIDDDGKTLVQLDMVYKDKTLTLYKNGTNDGLNIFSYTSENIVDAIPIPEASLGNRIVDNTRTTAAIYYSYILYDKALTQEEIQQNYKVNKSRYGEQLN